MHCHGKANVKMIICHIPSVFFQYVCISGLRFSHLVYNLCS